MEDIYFVLKAISIEDEEETIDIGISAKNYQRAVTRVRKALPEDKWKIDLVDTVYDN